MGVTTFTLARGTSADFPVQLNNRVTGNPSSDFMTTDTLAVAVWAGDSTAVLATPSAVWVSATAARLLIVFNNATTATLPPGTYSMVVTATRGGRSGVVANLALKVTPGPGTDVTPLAFTSRSDLTLYAPWLDDLQSATDQANFAEQQAMATQSLVRTLCNACGTGRGGLRLGDPGFIFMAGTSAGSSNWLRQQLIPLVPNSTPPASMPARRYTLPNFVDPTVSTALLLYPEVKEYCARLAISYVCEVQVGSQRDFLKQAAMQRHEAANLFLSSRFEIDLSNPQTGYGFAVNGGSSSRL